jgi:ParB-like chromosome segregation protein Spo0J
MKAVPTTDLTVKALFSTLFPVDEEIVGAIAENMKVNGFNPAKPIAVWTDADGDLVVVDGHQRLVAARVRGLTTVDISLLIL